MSNRSLPFAFDNDVLSREAAARRQAWAMTVMLIGIFLFGAAAGLFASAWLDDNPQYTESAKSRISDLGILIPAEPAGSPPRPLDEEGERVFPQREPEMPARLPVLPLSSDDDVLPEQAVPTPTPETAIAAPSAPLPAPAINADVSEEPEPPVPEVLPSVEESAPAPAPAPKQALKPKRKPQPKRAEQQDREIERIRRQAGEELRYRPDEGAARAQSRQRKVSREERQSVNRRPLLVRCEARAQNILQRELCKWEVCGGHWGKDGCPSYDKPRGVS